MMTGPPPCKAMLAPGTVVYGKWNHVRYDVIRTLGTGANGQVYLVRHSAGLAAMKVCDRAEDVALEWGILERVGKAGPWFPSPVAIDDDRDRSGVYFYVMESIEGASLHQQASALKGAHAHAVLTQMLAGVQALHRHGYAFCDLKPENMLVAVDRTSQQGVRTRFVDIGGVTAFGRSVRQFTPFYDRAFWSLGSRKADAAYDVCACALVFLFSFVAAPPASLVGEPPESRRAWLAKATKKAPPVYQSWLADVLEGRITEAGQALRALPANSWDGSGRGRSRSSQRPRKSGGQSRAKRSHQAVQKTGAPSVRRTAQAGVDWTEWLMWASLGAAAMVTVTAWADLLR